ncbi:MAG: DUF4244 domain-containing protein [Actinomycetaceae bacterium]|nr:DUF4244 domain-containing protein [Actinomycetaceae bacterium]MDU0971011.1 DUF4244 domain-containing protein [Actinomycetaceae bacterium]
MAQRFLDTQARIHCWLLRAQSRAAGEEGMATAEYAIGTLAAAAFAGILLAVIKGGGIKEALTAIIKQALSV